MVLQASRLGARRAKKRSGCERRRRGQVRAGGARTGGRGWARKCLCGRATVAAVPVQLLARNEHSERDKRDSASLKCERDHRERNRGAFWTVDSACERVTRFTGPPDQPFNENGSLGLVPAASPRQAHLACSTSLHARFAAYYRTQESVRPDYLLVARGGLLIQLGSFFPPPLLLLFSLRPLLLLDDLDVQGVCEYRSNAGQLVELWQGGTVLSARAGGVIHGEDTHAGPTRAWTRT